MTEPKGKANPHATGRRNDAAEQAIALRYAGAGAPRVTAKGRGKTAERILAIAHEHNIPLHEDPDLVTLLAKLELGDEIPRSLYVAVAEVIAFAYRVSGKSTSQSKIVHQQVNGDTRSRGDKKGIR